MNSLFKDRNFRLWMLLMQTRELLIKVREQEISKYGITREQAGVLNFIMNTDKDTTATAIAKWLVREPQSVSGLLARMESKGVVKKVKEPHNRGKVNIIPTEKGQIMYRQTYKIEAIKEIMSCLSEEEYHQIWSCLEKLRDKALSKITAILRPPLP